ncbi:MAG: ATPase [Prevotella sp.]|nr:ATPase [Prevotella sp.]
MNALIADSGSTKTHWALVGEDGEVENFSTSGINPVHMSVEEIRAIVASLNLGRDSAKMGVSFYGAGCAQPFSKKVEEALKGEFPDADVFVGSDMLGAARALFGNGEGIACILGTGSNSCLYDGREIVNNIPPLGYILGDEGSGAVLGRMFFNAMFKGFLPEGIREAYLKEEQLTHADVIDRVYRQPQANRFLASTSHFISRHLNFPELRALVEENFRGFFLRNVLRYGRRDVPVGFVGSIAWVYRDILESVASEFKINIAKIVQSPIELLVKQ